MLALEDAFKLLWGLRAHDAIRVFKTWVNAWCTSSRFHERVILPCLFGCPGCEDRQAHYSMCPNLFAIQTFLTPRITDFDPLKRLGLKEPQLDKLKLVACTFSAYHALKFKVAPMFSLDGHLSNLVEMHPSTQISFLESFAEAFRVEAVELALPTRRFDSHSFLNSLTGVPASEEAVTLT